MCTGLLIRSISRLRSGKHRWLNVNYLFFPPFPAKLNYARRAVASSPTTPHRIRARRRGLRPILNQLTRGVLGDFTYLPLLITSIRSCFMEGFAVLRSSTGIQIQSAQLDLMGRFLLNFYLFSIYKFFTQLNFTAVQSYVCLAPLGSKVKRIVLSPTQGSSLLASSRGVFANVTNLSLGRGLSVITLPSGSIKFIPILSRCSFTTTSSIGLESSDALLVNSISSKASSRFALGFRPKVRGVAKNPVDHPHGGRTKSIKFPRTPWGRPTKLK